MLCSFKEIVVPQSHEEILPHLLSRRSIVLSLTFRHQELIFVFSEERSKLHFLHADILQTQNHLLKRQPSFTALQEAHLKSLELSIESWV